jgi:hypothetical protein
MPATPPCQPRIAILGAGPAGLSTAWFLKKLGYMDVLVLEKLGRVGGLACTINSGYKTFDLGANYITPAFWETRKLAKAVGARTYKGSAYTEAFEKDGKLHYRPIVDYVREDPNDPGKKVSYLRLGRAALKYLHLRIGARKWIDAPDFGIVEERDDLCVPFKEWLETNDLLVFERAFQIPITMMGYGFLNEIATPYALKYLSPLSFFNLMMRGLPWGLGDAFPWPRRFEEGFQRVFQKLSWKLDVRENVDVKKIKRTPTDRRPIKITFEHPDQAGTEVHSRTLYFDHLVLACPLTEDALTFMELSGEEKELFDKVKTRRFVHITVRAVEKGTGEPFRMKYPVLLFPPFKPHTMARPWAAVQLFPEDTNLIQFYAHEEEARRDPLYDEMFPSVRKDFPGHTQQERVAITIEKVVFERVRELLNKMHAEPAGGADKMDARWISYICWSYFGHVTSEEIRDRYYTKLEAQQGKNNTWYAGGVTNFELIEPIVCYAKALAGRIDKEVREDARRPQRRVRESAQRLAEPPRRRLEWRSRTQVREDR